MIVETRHFITDEERFNADEFYAQLMRNAGARPMKRLKRMEARYTDWYTEHSEWDRYAGQVKICVMYSYSTRVACAVTSPLKAGVLTIVQWRGYSDTTNRQIDVWTELMIREAEERGYIKSVEIVKLPSKNYYGSRKNPIKFKG